MFEEILFTPQKVYIQSVSQERKLSNLNSTRCVLSSILRNLDDKLLDYINHGKCFTR